MESILALSEVFPGHSEADLAKLLSACNGSTERAAQAILAGKFAAGKLPNGGKVGKRRKLGMDEWLETSFGPDPSVNSYKRANFKYPDKVPSGSALAALQSPASLPSGSKQIAKPTKLLPISLSDPSLVSKHCDGLITLIHNVLPPKLAANLFVHMVKESQGDTKSGTQGWEKNRWYLVDREVESPHTTMFYVDKDPTECEGSSHDRAGYSEAAQYWYNGQQKEARYFTSEINEARKVITSLVRNILNSRAKHPLESDTEWTPNVAAANCYRGRYESVGFHSDVLTYLGPYPTIASLSLGVTRPFRIRRVLSVPNIEAEPIRTIDITLPHNSLCIMHAGFQELYKHSVPTVSRMDVFRIPKSLTFDMGSEIASQGWSERINMTFRFYRPDFGPRQKAASGFKGTPICSCGVPCNLRPDAKGKARARLDLPQGKTDLHQEEVDTKILYFWTCNAGSQNLGKSCGFFKLLDMQAEGRGKWYESG